MTRSRKPPPSQASLANWSLGTLATIVCGYWGCVFVASLVEVWG